MDFLLEFPFFDTLFLFADGSLGPVLDWILIIALAALAAFSILFCSNRLGLAWIPFYPVISIIVIFNLYKKSVYCPIQRIFLSEPITTKVSTTLPGMITAQKKRGIDETYTPVDPEYYDPILAQKYNMVCPLDETDYFKDLSKWAIENGFVELGSFVYDNTVWRKIWIYPEKSLNIAFILYALGNGKYAQSFYFSTSFAGGKSLCTSDSSDIFAFPDEPDHFYEALSRDFAYAIIKGEKAEIFPDLKFSEDATVFDVLFALHERSVRYLVENRECELRPGFLQMFDVQSDTDPPTPDEIRGQLASDPLELRYRVASFMTEVTLKRQRFVRSIFLWPLRIVWIMHRRPRRFLNKTIEQQQTGTR